MLYLYDQAIVHDLERSFSEEFSPTIKMIDSEGIISLAAQIKDDKIKFPLIALKRNPYSVDSSLTNFTKIHKGVQAVIDPKTNNLYYERALPISLTYSMTILTTNQADMDELVKEMTFKYISMFFLKIDLPYECDRPIRFGIESITNDNFEQSSGAFEYISGGRLYQTIIPLRCQGAVLLTYTAQKLKRIAPAEIEIR